MSKNKILRSYVSPIDQFMIKFDHEHPGLSKSQREEIEKYRRIYRLRDKVNPTSTENKLPEDF